jgi:hypothetical protein
MMVTEVYENNEGKHSTTEVILHHQHNDQLYSESSSNVKDKSIYASEQSNGGGQNDGAIKTEGRSGYSKTVTSTSINNQRIPVLLSHLSPSARSHQLNQRRRNHRRGLSADRGKLSYPCSLSLTRIRNFTLHI